MDAETQGKIQTSRFFLSLRDPTYMFLRIRSYSMRPFISCRLCLALHEAISARAGHALSASPENPQVQRMRICACQPRHSRLFPTEDPGGHTARGALLEGTLTSAWQNGERKAATPAEHVRFFASGLGLPYPKRKLPTLPCEVQSLTREEKKRSCLWVQISIKVPVTIAAHSFRSRQCLPHFILSRWPSS